MIHFVPPESLKPWDFYRNGILEIVEKSEGRVSFIPEDIYHHIKTGRAFLYRVADDGFFVVEKCIDSISADVYMNVWLMWFKPGAGLKFKDELIAYLDQMAKVAGCAWIDFGSTREAWVKLLEKDFTKHMVTLRRVA